MSHVGNFWSAFSPSPEIGIAEYAIRKIFNEEERPFDFLAFPHMVAPGGWMDSFDAAWIRDITCQTGSRLGKTFFVLCGSLYLADLAPCNQILAGNTQDLGLQQTERVRLMGAQVPMLKEAGIEDTLKQRLRFGGNTIYAAWSKSPGTLSNINALFGGASELDLWEWVGTSKHPDPEQMFGDRFKDNDNRRIEIYESIPTLKGTYLDKNGEEKPRSRIEARRLKGSDCKFWVCCPRCGGAQVLEEDRITFEGYLCEHSGCLITDQQRKAFIRSGVWAPRGCTVDSLKSAKAASERLKALAEASELPEGHKDLESIRDRLRWRGWDKCGYLIGTPDNDGQSASYQLSSFYALSLTWARIAEKKSDDQNWINQWRGETFEPVEEDEYDIESEAAELANAITSDIERDVVPEWAQYVIVTGDRQKKKPTRDPYPWMVTAWNEDLTRVHIMKHGCARFIATVEGVLAKAFEEQKASNMLMDSGFMSHEQYKWCLKMTVEHGLKVWPVKGDKSSVVKHHYKPNDVEDEQGRKATYSKIKRVHINTQSTQEWATRLLEERTNITIFKDDPGQHQSICEQLLNEQETLKQSSSTWDVITTAIPNDDRDNLRYAFVGAQMAKADGVNNKRGLVNNNYAAADEKEAAGFIRKRNGGGIRRR